MFSFRGVRWRGWQDRIGPFRNNWRPPRSNSFWAEKSGRWLPGSLSSRRDSFSWKRGFHILANRGISLVTDTETRNIPTTRVTSVLATPSFFLPPSFSILDIFLLWILRSEEEEISMQFTVPLRASRSMIFRVEERTSDFRKYVTKEEPWIRASGIHGSEKRDSSWRRG